MRTRKLTSFFLIFFTVSCLLPVNANSEEFKDDEYYKFVKEVFIKAQKTKKDDYYNLRELYAHTSFFDPNVAPTEIREILEKLKRKDVPNKEKQSLHNEILNGPLIKHMGHIDTHLAMHAYWRDFGDDKKANHYATIARAIGYSVLETGDGLTPETAFVAINKTEQHFVLRNFLKRSYEGSKLKNINGIMFDVFETTNPETGKKEKIYFNLIKQFGRGHVLRDLKKTDPVLFKNGSDTK